MRHARATHAPRTHHAHITATVSLPLLNRFEKQVFTPEHALSPLQRGFCKALAEWADGVAAELGLLPSATISQKRRAFAHAFCGWHDGTLASLALQLPTDVPEEEAIALGQSSLLRIAKPLAAFHSPRLRALPESDSYFIHHENLLTAADHYFVQPTGGKKRLFLLLTQSPITHCKEALGQTPPLGDVRFVLTQLSRFGSEDALGTAVGTFLSGGDEIAAFPEGDTAMADGSFPSSHVLLIQFDP